MPANASFTAGKTQPVVVGTGLIALDAVVSESEATRFWAGGSCGNVLAILSYLGWQSLPVSRLDTEDSAGGYVLADLRRWGVRTDFLQLKPHARTPIIIHKIRRSREGLPYHRFSMICPVCGGWFPAYRPTLLSSAVEVAQEIEHASVFFFDRVSPGALHLAKEWSRRGAVVVFEPSSVRNERLHRDALEIADIVKYSEERAKYLVETGGYRKPKLEIQTLGPEGLRFRTSLDGYDSNRWQQVEAFPVEDFKDAGGAGDWCTSGLIHSLCSEGQSVFPKVSEKRLLDALNFSQALAAWSCRFEGARGGMYLTARQDFDSQVAKILAGSSIPSSPASGTPEDKIGLFKEICRSCQNA